MQSEVITFICCHSHTNVELIFVLSMQRCSNSYALHSHRMKDKLKHFVPWAVECIVMYCID